MSFRGHDFPGNVPEFPRADTVCTYLQSYADRFSLEKYIRFETTVQRVYKNPGEQEWSIDSVADGGKTTEKFDAVSVANGHYEKGMIPAIPGIE